MYKLVPDSNIKYNGAGYDLIFLSEYDKITYFNQFILGFAFYKTQFHIFFIFC